MITSLIVAASRNEVIGASGELPWYLPDDLRRFRRLTTGHAVVAGRRTHESIVGRLGRPLPERTTVVLSSRVPALAGSATGGTAAGAPGPAPTRVLWAPSLESALSAARAAESAARVADEEADGGEIFVIGGTSVYEKALPYVDRIYLTRVHREIAGDTTMPPGWLDGFRLVGQPDPPGLSAEDAYSWLDYVREPS